ncbi:ribonuclease H-like domain-containing protein [Xylariales sp. AK1849]|nr:ribonuclease H-like domain-containing protein [Xylariales sp. AK1849]
MIQLRSSMRFVQERDQASTRRGMLARIRSRGSRELSSFSNRKDAEDFVAGKAVKSADDKKKKEGDKFYAVAVGRIPGIYTEWTEAQEAFQGWKGPKYKKFGTRSEAVEYIRTNGDEAGQASIANEPTEPPLKKTKNDEGEGLSAVLPIYTDGSSMGNGKAGAVAGVGVWFGKDDQRNVSEPLTGELQTNQRAELTAILRAMQKVSVDQDIRIYTDSRYSISCVTSWYKGWEAKGWKTGKGEPVKNMDLVQAIRAKMQDRDDSGSETLFEWVKGHASTEGNVKADELAIRGAKLNKGSV